MMFESLMQTSPAPENGCWRTAAPPDSSSMVPILIGDDGEKFVRIHPKRLEIRQMRSLDKVNGLIPRKGRCMKKKRPADENNDVECCTSQPEEDVVLQGTSSFVKEAKQDYNVACWSHGSISVIGRRREMEDAVAVELGFLTRGFKKYYDFFGVYDGHGGSSVAKACRHRLHKLVVQMVGEEEDDIINWKKVMSESFKKMDEEVNRNGAAVATVGSTAVVAVVGKDEVVVANCGDSRAVLSRGGTAIPLSSDHKPERPDELERIELSGGKVIDWNGHRILGVLATSRSIGDDYLKPYVTPEPELIVSRRCEEDEFLILASDGLWDVISNDVACHIVRKCLGGHVRRASREMANGKSLPHNTAAKGQAYYNKLKNASLAAEAASILAELAIVRGSCDNISVIVVELRTLRS